MTGPCPSPDAWTRLLDPEGEPLPEDILSHLDACPQCAKEAGDLIRARPQAPAAELRARVLARLRTPQRIPLRWAGMAAAAALLLWAGLSRLGRGEGERLCSSVSVQVAREPEPLPRVSAEWAPGRDQRVVLGRAVSAELSAGGRLCWKSGLDLCLESGRVCLETEGERVRLEWGGIRAELEAGEIEAGFLPSSSRVGLLMGSAWAEEGAVPYVRVLRGTAVLRRSAGEPLEIRAGKEARPAPGGGWETLVLPARAPGGWTRLASPASLRDQTVSFFDSPALAYRYEVSVRKCDTSAECALTFSGFEIPLGAALEGAGEGWTLLAVEIRDGWCRAVAGPVVLASLPAKDLASLAYPSSERGLGLKAWGGAVEVRSARWRILE